MPEANANGPSQSSRDIEDWNKIASQYVNASDGRKNEQNPMYSQLKDVLWESLGDLQGLEVLDAGCGDGWFSRLMHDKGARVVGIDGSTHLLDFARSNHPDIEFHQTDLAQGIPDQFGPFDRIVSLMVFMDIPELDLLFRDMRRVIAKFGKLIFVILHPCFFQYRINQDAETGDWYRKVTNYQDPQIWRIDSFGGHNHYHRNLTHYCNLLRINNFAITRLYEPEWNPQPDAENAHVGRRWPICMLVEAQPLPAR